MKTLKVRVPWWRRAKVAAAEAEVPLTTFVEQALEVAVEKHDRLKTTVHRTTPVQFVSGGGDGRG